MAFWPAVVFIGAVVVSGFTFYFEYNQLKQNNAEYFAEDAESIEENEGAIDDIERRLDAIERRIEGMGR